MNVYFGAGSSDASGFLFPTRRTHNMTVSDRRFEVEFNTEDANKKYQSTGPCPEKEVIMYECERPDCNHCPHARFNWGTEEMECNAVRDMSRRRQAREAAEYEPDTPEWQDMTEQVPAWA